MGSKSQSKAMLPAYNSLIKDEAVYKNWYNLSFSISKFIIISSSVLFSVQAKKNIIQAWNKLHFNFTYPLGNRIISNNLLSKGSNCNFLLHYLYVKNVEKLFQWVYNGYAKFILNVIC